MLVEGGGYEKIWLETQPMGGEMYAKHNMEAAIELEHMANRGADTPDNRLYALSHAIYKGFANRNKPISRT